MHSQPVKGHLARRALPPIPTELAYPNTRQAAVTIPSRIARDFGMGRVNLCILIELAAAGGDTQWVMVPTTTFLAKTLGVHHSAVSRGLYDLEARHYIELKRISRQTRYARIVTPGYALDWE